MNGCCNPSPSTQQQMVLVYTMTLGCNTSHTVRCCLCDCSAASARALPSDTTANTSSTSTCDTSASAACIVLGSRHSTTGVSWGGLNNSLPGVHHLRGTVLCLLTLLACGNTAKNTSSARLSAPENQAKCRQKYKPGCHNYFYSAGGPTGV